MVRKIELNGDGIADQAVMHPVSTEIRDKRGKYTGISDGVQLDVALRDAAQRLRRFTPAGSGVARHFSAFYPKASDIVIQQTTGARFFEDSGFASAAVGDTVFLVNDEGRVVGRMTISVFAVGLMRGHANLMLTSELSAVRDSQKRVVRRAFELGGKGNVREESDIQQTALISKTGKVIDLNYLAGARKIKRRPSSAEQFLKPLFDQTRKWGKSLGPPKDDADRRLRANALNAAIRDWERVHGTISKVAGASTRRGIIFALVKMVGLDPADYPEKFAVL